MWCQCIVGGWNTPTDTLPIDFCHLWCAAMMTASDWFVHSLMLFFHDLRGLPLRQLPSTFCMFFSAVYCDGRHGRTMIACDFVILLYFIQCFLSSSNSFESLVALNWLMAVLRIRHKTCDDMNGADFAKLVRLPSSASCIEILLQH